MFNQYPYLNLNDLNLDYLLNEIKSMYNDVTNFVSINAIKYADPIQWNITSQYEKNTVVIDPLTGTAYISVAAVPSGVSLTRTEYWTVVFDLGSFVTRAAQNFTSHWESDTTTNATFSTTTGGWLVWGDVLYKALTNITAGDTYVIGGNIEHFTIEDLYNTYLNTIANILAMVGNLVDLTTTDKTNIVAAINELVSNDATLQDAIGTLTDLKTADKTNVVAAINEVVSNRLSYKGGLLNREKYREKLTKIIATGSIQSAVYYNGSFILGVHTSGTSSKLITIDADTYEITNSIDREYGHLNGLCIYDGYLYVTTGSDSPDPYAIYKLELPTFNVNETYRVNGYGSVWSIAQLGDYFYLSANDGLIRCNLDFTETENIIEFVNTMPPVTIESGDMTGQTIFSYDNELYYLFNSREGGSYRSLGLAHIDVINRKFDWYTSCPVNSAVDEFEACAIADDGLHAIAGVNYYFVDTIIAMNGNGIYVPDSVHRVFATPISNIDLDNLKMVGWYCTTSANNTATLTNKPTGASISLNLSVDFYGTLQVRQTITQSNNGIWTRTYDWNSDTWSDWKNYYTVVSDKRLFIDCDEVYGTIPARGENDYSELTLDITFKHTYNPRPKMVVSIWTSSGEHNEIECKILSLTTTGATVRLRGQNTSDRVCTVEYLAYGYTAESGNP